MSGQFNLAQAAIWVSNTRSRLASSIEIESLISEFASKPGKPDPCLMVAYVRMLALPAAASQRAKAPSYMRERYGDNLHVVAPQFGQEWAIAIEELASAVRNGSLPLFARLRSDRAAHKQISPLDCTEIAFREDTEPYATYPDNSTFAWDRLRFDADRVKLLWVLSSTGQATVKGGRPLAADWPAIEEALGREVALVGLPRKDGTPGWRTNADVVRWVEERLGDDEQPGKTALKENVANMLKRIRDKLAGN